MTAPVKGGGRPEPVPERDARVARDQQAATAIPEAAQQKLKNHLAFTPGTSMARGVARAQQQVAAGLAEERVALQEVVRHAFHAMLEAEMESDAGYQMVHWYAHQAIRRTVAVDLEGRSVLVVPWTHPAIQVGLTSPVGEWEDIRGVKYRTRSVRPIARARFTQLLPQLAGVYEPGGVVSSVASQAKRSGLKAVKLEMTPEQVKAFIARMNGVLLVTGAPGTGKTTVAFQRIRFLLDQQHERETAGVPYAPALTRVFLASRNLKGGVAKTTNAVAVAETLATRGYRVLVIDADHQCTASELLLGEGRMLKADSQGLTLHDLLREFLKPEFDGYFPRYVIAGEAGVIDARQRLSVLPCSVRIDELQSNVARARRGMLTGAEFSALWRRRRVAMGRWLRASYDFTIIDCPPSLTRHVQFLLRLSSGIVIPAVPDHLSLRGALTFVERLEVKGIDTQVLGTLWTLYRSQVEKHRTVISLAKRRISKPGKAPRPFETVVPNASAIAAGAEPMDRAVSLRGKYTSEFAALYSKLCDEIVARCGADVPELVEKPGQQVSLWGFGVT